MKWIKVKERLPEEEQEILTYWKDRNMIQLQTFRTDAIGSWFLHGWQSLLLEDGHVTHWQPLPEKPE